MTVVVLTMASWFGLGLWYGFGSCPSTDWHWQVEAALGEKGLPASFVEYVLDRLTGRSWDAEIVDLTVAVLGLAALGASVVLNWRDRKSDR